MARTVLWNRVLLDEFIDLASLSEDEERVIRARAAGWSRVKMCHEYNMSLAAIDRIVARLKSKYDAVQPYSDKLPETTATLTGAPWTGCGIWLIPRASTWTPRTTCTGF